MSRHDPRVFALLPLLLIAGGCGDDPERSPAPVAPPPSAAAPSAAPGGPAASPTAPGGPAASSTAPGGASPAAEPDPDDSVYVEPEPEEPDPTPEAGELPGAAQSDLDEALGLELGALEGAPKDVAAQRQEILQRLPDDPRRVLAALKNYPWYSPEARALYDRAVAGG